MLCQFSKKPQQFDCQCHRQRERKKIVKLPNSKKKKKAEFHSCFTSQFLRSFANWDVRYDVMYTYLIAGNVVTYSHQLYHFVITNYEKMRGELRGFFCEIKQIFATLLAWHQLITDNCNFVKS